MSYPPQHPGQQPPQPYPPQQPYAQPGYPPPGYGYPPPYPPQPLRVQQVGMSVTKPAWTIGDILWVFFTGGLALPFIWLKRRSRTTVTRHRR